jgi:hypothetical protein
MMADHADSYEGFQLVDPSVDPSILFDIGNGLLDSYAAVQALKELLRRFPTIEYAVGFDGIDDWVCLDKLDLSSQNVEVESKVWISQSSSSDYIFDVTDSESKSIIGLANTPDDHSVFRLHYRTSKGIKTQTLSRLDLETWQSFRVWSSGSDFSVTVDGDQVAFVPDIDLGKGPSKVYFGTNGPRTMYFEGMIKYLRVMTDSDQIFSLKSSGNLQIEDKTDTATTAGIHNMKKRRFQKEFRSITS